MPRLLSGSTNCRSASVLRAEIRVHLAKPRWTPKTAISPPEVSTDCGPSKPATRATVSTDPSERIRPGRAPSASACEPYRELIVEALGRGRNAVAIWQDLVDRHGFPARYASGRRFVAALRGSPASEAHGVITTEPFEVVREERAQGGARGPSSASKARSSSTDRGRPSRAVTGAPLPVRSCSSSQTLILEIAAFRFGAAIRARIGRTVGFAECVSASNERHRLLVRSSPIFSRSTNW
jgi:hypothetical protein